MIGTIVGGTPVEFFDAARRWNLDLPDFFR